MSLSLNMEIDSQLQFEDLHTVFEKAGLINITSNDGELSAEFRNSKMAVDAERRDDLPEPLTEGIGSEERWKVGSRIAFYYQISNPELCNKEISHFLKELANFTSANFVLSFQYENIYALRDRHGLRFMESSGLA
jgi:hypothetical protein